MVSHGYWWFFMVNHVSPPKLTTDGKQDVHGYCINHVCTVVSFTLSVSGFYLFTIYLTPDHRHDKIQTLFYICVI